MRFDLSDEEWAMLILPSVQVNIRTGQLPSAQANGARYLKLPVNHM